MDAFWGSSSNLKQNRIRWLEPWVSLPQKRGVVALENDNSQLQRTTCEVARRDCDRCVDGVSQNRGHLSRRRMRHFATSLKIQCRLWSDTMCVLSNTLVAAYQIPRRRAQLANDQSIQGNKHEEGYCHLDDDNHVELVLFVRSAILDGVVRSMLLATNLQQPTGAARWTGFGTGPRNPGIPQQPWRSRVVAER